MATLTRAALSRYRDALERASSGAQEAARRAIARWMDANPSATVEQLREAALRISETVLETYGGAASSVACSLFDSVMELEGMPVGAALPAADARIAALGGTVRRIAGDVDGSPESLAEFAERFGQAACYNVYRTANATVERNVARANARRDRGVRFARVPGGPEPCAWCSMLASRGFVYRSEEDAAAASHRDCSCAVVPGVRGSTQIEGYDPDYYRGRWLAM